MSKDAALPPTSLATKPSRRSVSASRTAQVLLNAYNGTRFSFDPLDLGYFDPDLQTAAFAVMWGRLATGLEPHGALQHAGNAHTWKQDLQSACGGLPATLPVGALQTPGTVMPARVFSARFLDPGSRAGERIELLRLLAYTANRSRLIVTPRRPNSHQLDGRDRFLASFANSERVGSSSLSDQISIRLLHREIEMKLFHLLASAVVVLGSTSLAESQSDELYFVENAQMAEIYHVGLPCDDPSDKGYTMVVETLAPSLFDESYVHGTLRYTINSMEAWLFPNQCLASRETPTVAIFRSNGQEIARAEFVYAGMFVNDLRVTSLSEAKTDETAQAIVDTVLQGGSDWYVYRSLDDGYDAFKAIRDLEALLSTAEERYVSQIYYLIGRILQRRDVMDAKALAKSGGDIENFWADRTNSDGERRYVSLLREAAELGHPGAAVELYEASGLDEHLFRYKSSASLLAPDKQESRRLVRKYGFIFDLAEEKNIGSLLSQLSGLAQKGYSVGERGVFEDPSLPPSAVMLEAILNRELAERLTTGDGMLAALYGIPSDLVYSCDGTWCRAAGGMVGRFRVNIQGLPECGEVTNGRTTCVFTMTMNHDMGEVFGNMPNQKDPVVKFAEGLLETATEAADWPSVKATMVRGDDSWSIEELVEVQ